MCFRPLTGINFNELEDAKPDSIIGFRPLTGINFNMYQLDLLSVVPDVSVPSRG